MACAASVYGIGYGRQEASPQRILPVFPAFLAAMSMVVLADDAFVFLFSWELMSLASWALVMAHHRTKDTAHAGYVYLVMAGFGTLSLLLCFGLLAGPHGGYAFAEIRAVGPSATVGALVLTLALLGAGSKAGVGAAARLAAARPPGGAEPRLSADDRGDDQARHLRPHAVIVFDLVGPPAWWWSAVVLVLGGSSAVLGVLYALMRTTSSACSPTTPSRTSASSSSAWAWRWPSMPTGWSCRRRSR